jgi:uroporphyrinogen decarboxylase
MLTKEERVLRVINRQDVDFLPSQITFSDRTRDKELSAALGLAGAHELDGYLQNHIHIALSLHDKTLFYRNDRAEMNRLKALGFCGACWDRKIVLDAWGMGIQVDSDGFFACFHPLQNRCTPELAEHMPPDVVRSVLFEGDIATAVAGYRVPDINRPHNYDDMAADLKNKSGEFIVLPSGYFGIYERAYALMGFEEFMIAMASEPKVVNQLLDKITAYKVEHAKKVVALGARIAHHGDDLGTQIGTLFSRAMFREFILPRLKVAWEPYNKAGLPIVMHSCGNLTDFIPDLLEIGLKVLEPVQTVMDLKYLKREFGKHLVFWGGIETQRLPFMSPPQVKKMARDAIHTLGKGGGHIIGPSQEIMKDVPLANVIALVETIVEERKNVLNA